jgi:hypothetical protein
MGPIGAGFRGAGSQKNNKKKKKTNYVPNQPKAVLMEYDLVLNCFFFEPLVQLPVLLI